MEVTWSSLYYMQEDKGNGRPLCGKALCQSTSGAHPPPEPWPSCPGLFQHPVHVTLWSHACLQGRQILELWLLSPGCPTVSRGRVRRNLPPACPQYDSQGGAHKCPCVITQVIIPGSSKKPHWQLVPIGTAVGCEVRMIPIYFHLAGNQNNLAFQEVADTYLPEGSREGIPSSALLVHVAFVLPRERFLS